MSEPVKMGVVGGGKYVPSFSVWPTDGEYLCLPKNENGGYGDFEPWMVEYLDDPTAELPVDVLNRYVKRTTGMALTFGQFLNTEIANAIQGVIGEEGC